MLTIVLDSEGPFPASSLGNVFRDLASDYKKFSKVEELVLVRAEYGSLRLKLTALALSAGTVYGYADKTFDAFNHVHDFAKNISEVIVDAGHGFYNAQDQSPQTVIKSAITLLDAAKASNSNLHMIYRGAKGDELLLDFKVNQIEHARHTLMGAKKAKATQQRLPARHTEALAFDDRILQLAAARSNATTSGLSRDDTSIRLAIELFVEAMKAKGSYKDVEAVALRLEAHGLRDIAAMVRQAW